MKKKDEIAVEKILDCAKEEFMEKGFEGASMRSIAEKSGYTTGICTDVLRTRANCSKNL